MAAMAQGKRTLYEILEVPADAEPEDIGHAHERKVLEIKRSETFDPNAAALVKQAFEVLSNAKRRAAYDASLVSSQERAAASAQATADLDLSDDAAADDRSRKLRLLGLVGGMALIFAVLFLVFRPRPAPPPPAPEPVAEAPKPAPPPPPRLRNANEIAADASTSTGQVLSYSMSGTATPLGMAVEVDTGQMVTTCHGIPAGSKLVVKVGKESMPADLTITDESLDLCRLSIPGFTTPPLKLATEDAKAGDKIFVAAVNDKGEMAATEGKVTQLRPTPTGQVLELSVPVSTHGSGGGVFNDRGQLVGIATTPHAFGAGLNIALPVSWIPEMRSRAAAAAK
ncbi:MAG TPA: trypsin-like peptidase domain-containing protein [Usitatibacter sp.]|nr:trypsin-like peptidase domain-containing protein [Usitatibacter sp.]